MPTLTNLYDTTANKRKLATQPPLGGAAPTLGTGPASRGEGTPGLSTPLVSTSTLGTGPTSRGEGTPGLRAVPTATDIGGMLPMKPPPSIAGAPQTGGPTPGNAGPGGMTLGSFGPDSNLIGTSVLPGSSPSTAHAEGLASGAADKFAGAGYTPFQGLDPSLGGFRPVGPANTSKGDSIYDYLEGIAKGQLSGASGGGGGGGGAQLSGQLQPLLDKILNGPDRVKLAGDAYDELAKRGQPGFEEQLRAVGQKAGALGRVGSQLTTADLGTVAQRYNEGLDSSRRELATNAAGQTLDDQLKQLGAARDTYGAVSAANNAGVASQSAAQSRAFDALLGLGDRRYNEGRDTYGDTVSERDKGYNAASDTYGRASHERDTRHGYEGDEAALAGNQLAGLGSYARGERANDASNRDEVRGERGYQYGLSQDATNNGLRQYLAEQGISDTDFQHAMQMLSAGEAGNPAGAYEATAQQRGAEASGNTNAAMELLARMGYGGATKKTTAPVS